MALKTGTNAPDTFSGTDLNDTLLGWDAINLPGNEGPAEDGDGIFGGKGYDLIRGGAGNDTLLGNAGHDTLYGGAGADVLDGLEGPDTVFGDGGDDTFFGGFTQGRDAIDGGAGVDLLYWSDDLSTTGVTLSLANPAVAAVLAGGTTVVNVEVIEFEGSTKNDHVTGGAYGDRLDGRAGDDFLSGGAGNDTLIGREGHDTLIGGAGRDSFDMTLGLTRVVDGGSGRDGLIFRGTESGVAAVFSLALPDVLQTLADGTTLRGIDQVDFAGGFGNDHVQGGRFADTLAGWLGADWLSGGAGSDVIYGGPNDPGSGPDTLLGGAGDDLVEIAPSGAAQVARGGAGQDTLWLHQSYIIEGAQFSLADPAREVVLANGTRVSGFEVLIFDGSDDTGEVDDVTGGIGADTMNGFGGNDRLNGWSGADELTGGRGADVFEFSRLDAVDVITDFAHGVDKIGLDHASFAGLALGALAAGAFVAGTAALDAGDRILYDAATGGVWYDADGLGGVGAVRFALAGPGLTSADFTVF